MCQPRLRGSVQLQGVTHSCAGEQAHFGGRVHARDEAESDVEVARIDDRVHVPRVGAVAPGATDVAKHVSNRRVALIG